MEPFYLVVGLGKTGLSIAGYLKRRKASFALFDTRLSVPGIADFHKKFPGIPLFLGTLPEKMYSQITEIITSPGVPLENVYLQKALAESIPVIGDIECLARELKAPVIAITGTNGKSTVTTLVGEMAKKAGILTAVAGNIGHAVLDLVDDGNDYALWVLELSSFQLDLTGNLKPHAATILNISPDHLDRHADFMQYKAAKHRIYKNASYQIYNREDENTRPERINPAGKVSSFGLSSASPDEWGLIHQSGQTFLGLADNCLIKVDKLKIKGKHNWQNAMAAAALAFAAGIPEEAIVFVLEHFKGLPHRCQWVKTVDGVEWINDSKGTNTGAAISAITGIGSSSRGRIVLIAGGLGKGADFSELRSCVKAYVRSVVVIGTDGAKIEAALADLVPVLPASSLEEAVKFARNAAKNGDVVLLSPACASMDMFRDFNHRGECFTELVNQL